MILKHVPNSYMCFTCIRLPDWRETVWYAGVAVQVSRNQQESRTTNEFLAHFLSSPLLLCLWYNHCTFCLFIPPCHVQAQIQTEEDENEQEKDDENVNTSLEEKSPTKDGAKTEQKSPQNGEAKAEVEHAGGRDREPKIPQNKEASESNPQKGETDKSDAESSTCEGKGVVSLSSNVNENKENETKGDETQSL